MYKNKYNLPIAIVWLLLALYTTIFVGPGHPDQIRIGIGNLMQYAISFAFFYIYIKIRES